MRARELKSERRRRKLEFLYISSAVAFLDTHLLVESHWHWKVGWDRCVRVERWRWIWWMIMSSSSPHKCVDVFTLFFTCGQVAELLFLLIKKTSQPTTLSYQLTTYRAWHDHVSRRKYFCATWRVLSTRWCHWKKSLNSSSLLLLFVTPEKQKEFRVSIFAFPLLALLLLPIFRTMISIKHNLYFGLLMNCFVCALDRCSTLDGDYYSH